MKRHIFHFVLAWAAGRTGLLIIAAYCASNHYPIVACDRLGRAPDFARLFNGLLGRIVNSMLQRVAAPSGSYIKV